MKKISADTLQEALSQAALEFGCSVTELSYEVVQYESKGFLGIGKKPAIIVVDCNRARGRGFANDRGYNNSASHGADSGANVGAGTGGAGAGAGISSASDSFASNDTRAQDSDKYTKPSYTSHANHTNNTYSAPKPQSTYNAQNAYNAPRESREARESREVRENRESSSFGFSRDSGMSRESNPSREFDTNREFATNRESSEVKAQDSEFFDASDFIQEAHNDRFLTKEEIIQEISEQIEELLSFMPYKLNRVQISFYDPQTLYIYLDGNDSALLIGERGYRYKALSYLLFNWIQPTYGYNIRLEIAQFLKNQEDAIDSYLVGIINEVRREGKAQTKPLDGILAFIALKKLRSQFPDKYISFRESGQNERYIIINDFYR